ncbi:deoxyguanosinetriphosphate triphosphohydrolase family protein [Ferrimonas sediminicola]|uniref:Deoxyguanosinetriphosphate triphosphohydrolase-like protein n=1 Tax=Ferrimonas sediminicola TaxID=2569538 RepID=A0A4U1BAF1_9GAMM|nr:anti-phage deoxyguanosine triphosphatase [Ferrimonas sediminicola]TKB47747.1 deoxyguanosinetriphosphate triphosphohydrolase family protein [Ferrimonas sediminicola]
MQYSDSMARRIEEAKQRQDDQRSPLQRDKARIMHSAAFRRLQAKTQVLGVGMNDFYRTRLTHSLEAAQIGTGIAAQLRRAYPTQAELIGSDHLIESLCLAHDLGHPPYGHGGEVALNYMMRDHGGFEGNGQTFRILARLEPYTESFGMNLTRRTLLGVLKYPVLLSRLGSHSASAGADSFRQLKADEWAPDKGIFDDDAEILDWVLAPLSDHDRRLLSQTRPGPNGRRRSQYRSLDASIMEMADDIAYSVHDLEDAIVMGIVSYSSWRRKVAEPIAAIGDNYLAKRIDAIGEKLFSDEHHQRKDAIGTLVNAFVTHIHLEKQGEFDSPLLAYHAVMEPGFDTCLNRLKRFVYECVIRKPEVQILEYKGQQVVMELFEAFASDPMRLLPKATQKRWQAARDAGHSGHRVIADYISGMTDEFAARLHQNLFTPKMGNLAELHSPF